VEVTETDGTFSFNLQDDATVTLSGVVNTWKSGACDLTLYEDGMMEVTGSGAMADHTYETPWMYYTDRIKTLTIADEVTKIGCYAFHNCDFLENVILTENSKLKTISEHAFGITKSLPEFPFPASLTEIQSNAFSESGLTKVDLQKCTQLKKNGYYAFSGCAQLTTVILPESMNDVGDYAFSSCGSLISVTVYNPTPVFIYGNEFPNRANATLYVPAGSKAAYEAADNWKDFKEIVEMEVPSIATDLNEELRMKNEESVDGVWYDLQGRKVNGNNVKKGIYIVNGRKIIK